MDGNGKRTIAEILADDKVIDRAMGDAVMEALRRHKLLGNPVAEWRDGRVVWIAPEDIQIDDARAASTPNEFPPAE